ncbi:MAG: hypothetical protein GYA50_05640, partial [Eubacteriaceae bacterium]|nr:hypothetical protein [Eubacteriaceae bacterium]
MRDKHSSSGIGVFIGLIFVIAGVMWILNELNIVNVPLYLIWISVGKMWPLILICIGICIIFRSRIVTFLIALIYVVLIVLGAYALSGAINLPFIDKIDYYQNNNGIIGNEQHLDLSDGTTSAELILNMGVAEDTHITSADNNYLIDFKTNSNAVLNTSSADGRQIVNINTEKYRLKNSGFYLNKNVAWDILIKSGASEIDMNLKDLNVNSIDINSGASDIKGTLSSLAKRTNINISSGASDIEFKIPQGSACEVVSSAAATSITIDGTKISGIGKKTYRTDN